MQKSNLFVSETNNVSNLKVLEGLGSEYTDYLSEENFQKISELSDFHSIETDFAVKLKPWLLGFIFSSPRPMNPFSQDNLLKVTASNYGLASKGLETVDEHYSVLDSLSTQDQFQILKNVLILSEEDKEKNYELMIQTYLTFNLNKILNVDEKITKSIVPKKTWALVKNELIHKRNKLFFKRLVFLAEKNIPFQRSALSRATGTDTDAFAYSNGGVASALISLPLRYMHTTVEMVHRDDVENVIKLIYETLLKINGDETFSYFD